MKFTKRDLFIILQSRSERSRTGVATKVFLIGIALALVCGAFLGPPGLVLALVVLTGLTIYIISGDRKASRIAREEAGRVYDALPEDFKGGVE